MPDDYGHIKVTVIVAFHNAELTIGTTARSIFEQTLTELEIIFVNDGSLDRSFDIINDMLIHYPERIDNTSILFYTFSRGTAAAYDTALAHASGDYVITASPGDFFEANALKLMSERAYSADADIAWSEHFAGYPGRNKRIRIGKGAPELNLMRIDYGSFTLHNKLIRRRLLTDNRIAATKGVNSWKDICVVSKLLSLSPTVTFIHTPLYHCNRSTAYTSEYESRDHLTTTLLLEQWFVKQYPDNRYQPFLNNLKFVAKSCFLRGKDKDIKQWKATFPELNSRIMRLNAISLHRRWLYSALIWLPEWMAQPLARIFIK